MNNCCNCGAPRNHNQTACAYCNTPYGPRWPEVNEDGLRYQDEWVTEHPYSNVANSVGVRETLLANHILTPNEHREIVKRLSQVDVSYFK